VRLRLLDEKERFFVVLGLGSLTGAQPGEDFREG